MSSERLIVTDVVQVVGSSGLATGRTKSGEFDGAGSTFDGGGGVRGRDDSGGGIGQWCP